MYAAELNGMEMALAATATRNDNKDQETIGQVNSEQWLEK
jgi:hypothetical protein